MELHNVPTNTQTWVANTIVGFSPLLSQVYTTTILLAGLHLQYISSRLAVHSVVIYIVYKHTLTCDTTLTSATP